MALTAPTTAFCLVHITFYSRPPVPRLPPSHNNYKLMKMGGSNNQFQTPVFDQTKTQEVAGCIYDYNQLLLIDQLPSQYPQPKQNSSASNDHDMAICTVCRQLSASIIVPNFGCILKTVLLLMDITISTDAVASQNICCFSIVYFYAFL